MKVRDTRFAAEIQNILSPPNIGHPWFACAIDAHKSQNRRIVQHPFARRAKPVDLSVCQSAIATRQATAQNHRTGQRHSKFSLPTQQNFFDTASDRHLFSGPNKNRDSNPLQQEISEKIFTQQAGGAGQKRIFQLGFFRTGFVGHESSLPSTARKFALRRCEPDCLMLIGPSDINNPQKTIRPNLIK